MIKKTRGFMQRCGMCKKVKYPFSTIRYDVYDHENQEHKGTFFHKKCLNKAKQTPAKCSATFLSRAAYFMEQIAYLLECESEIDKVTQQKADTINKIHNAAVIIDLLTGNKGLPK